MLITRLVSSEVTSLHILAYSSFDLSKFDFFFSPRLFSILMSADSWCQDIFRKLQGNGKEIWKERWQDILTRRLVFSRLSIVNQWLTFDAQSLADKRARDLWIWNLLEIRMTSTAITDHHAFSIIKVIFKLHELWTTLQENLHFWWRNVVTSCGVWSFLLLFLFSSFTYIYLQNESHWYPGLWKHFCNTFL